MESRWSSRSPTTASTTIRLGSSSSAASSASSRSVASFSAGWRSMRVPGRLRRAHRLGRRGVEVADRDRDLEPPLARALEPAVRGDHRSAGGNACGRLRSGRLTPPATTTTTSSDMRFLRWYYPDQVLRVGGALQPPSQPGCPELPIRSGHRSARRRTRASRARLVEWRDAAARTRSGGTPRCSASAWCTLSGVLQLAAAVATITLVLVTGIESDPRPRAGDLPDGRRARCACPRAA